jgi:hypothetical protein
MTKAIYTDRAEKSVLEVFLMGRLLFIMMAWLSATYGGKEPDRFGDATFHSGIKWHTETMYYHTLVTVVWRVKLRLMSLGRFDLVQFIEEWGEKALLSHVHFSDMLHSRVSINGERMLQALTDAEFSLNRPRSVRSGWKEVNNKQIPQLDVVIFQCFMYSTQVHVLATTITSSWTSSTPWQVAY